jgi:hypothetical protein
MRAAVEDRRKIRKNLLDAVRVPMVHEARALDLDECVRRGHRSHELDRARKSRERRAAVLAAETGGLAGVDSVELADITT